MSLINCPECNRQISDKAHSCPYCGYPLNDILSNNYKYDIVFVSFSSNQNYKLKTIRYLREILNISLSDVTQIEKNAPYIILNNISLTQANQVKKSLSELDCKITINQNIKDNKNSDNEKVDYYYENENRIKCPCCGSTAIVIGQRGYSLFTGFLGSNKTVNRCGKCGYSWKPK